MSSKSERQKEADHFPFLLTPEGKDYLWGGERLKDLFNKNPGVHPIAETWECSTHPHGPSRVMNGPYKGWLLSDVLLENPDFLGRHPKCEPGQIPILVKFIDAEKDLSVQVHPSDDYANEHEDGQLGKTEMWYVIDAKPGAKLVYGFKRKIRKDQVESAIANGTIEKYLQYVPVHKNDVFFVKPGTVHAIGSGIIIAEIQESSDLTYRLYDYNRIDKNGQKRPLHIGKALDVLDLKPTPLPTQPLRVLKYTPGRAVEVLNRCKYFQVDRMLINTSYTRSMADYKTGENTFQVLLCYNGCGSIFDPVSRKSLNFFQGDTVFVPANSPDLKLHGRASLLRVRC